MLCQEDQAFFKMATHESQFKLVVGGNKKWLGGKSDKSIIEIFFKDDLNNYLSFVKIEQKMVDLTGTNSWIFDELFFAHENIKCELF